MHYNQEMGSILGEINRFFRFNLMYLFNPPWDTGIPVPELVDFISDHKPGRALDLGCGSGTNMAAFLAAGWRVDGIDFAWLAASKAKRKIRQFENKGKVYWSNVVDLEFLNGRYDLIYDIGCFHGLRLEVREKYSRNIKRLIKRNGHYLIYAFRAKSNDSFGIREVDIEKFSAFLIEEKRLESVDERNRQALFMEFFKSNN